jgi:hypothetical protein
VKHWTGIPTCVGFDSTKTLAKLAQLLRTTPNSAGVRHLAFMQTNRFNNHPRYSAAGSASLRRPTMRRD